MRRFLIFASCLLYFFTGKGQTCSNPGQTPQTAFPVCGTTTFAQSSVPLCSGRNIPGPCGTTGLTDRNPYWYKFTCITSGTLGFTISPLAANEDYDWQLFNVTGVTNLDAVYTNASLFVTCSWSGYYGNTGASAAGTANYACDGNTPLFVRMPNLVAGNSYLLMISHWTSGQSGYNLSFGGGTANITDTVTSHLTQAVSDCDGIHINLKLNKKMRCSSLAANGSDFTISNTATGVISATGAGCNGGFDLDSIQLTLSTPLPAGTYRLKAKLGTDLNTLLDVCGTPLAVGDSVDFTVTAQAPSQMDTVIIDACSPHTLRLRFDNLIRCSSVATDGSDFSITGPSPVTITSALALCGGVGVGSSGAVDISFAGPIQIGGTYTLRLQNGSDGNTVFNNCLATTPAGSVITFIVRDSVSATFASNVVYNACSASDTLKLSHPGGSNVNQWSWAIPGGTPATSTSQNQTVAYSTPGTYAIKLKVSNSFCVDSITVPVTINAIAKDSVAPKLSAAVAPCEGTQMLVKLNKKIKCNSIVGNGSDFSIRPAGAPIGSTVGVGCSTGQETDSLVINFSSLLPTGNYTLIIRNGSDGNTLVDNCNRTIPVNDSIANVSVVTHPLITIDSIAKVGCKPIELLLMFKEPVRCSSIAADGSDFKITGPSAVSIIAATGACSTGFTNTIKITLSNIITKGGTYNVVLQSGTDGNTLLNECNKASLANISRPFVAGDTVNAAFTYSVAHSCSGRDTLSFFHTGDGGITQWRWQFDNGVRSSLQNPVVLYSTFGNRQVSLTVTNGICTDSTTQPVFIASDTLHASFEAASFYCPGDVVKIVNKSSGNIVRYAWNYGDGFTSAIATPPVHVYPIPNTQQVEYGIKLTITGSLGCSVDTTIKVKALNNCVIAVPTAFTPNGDGLNDYLYPTNAYKADKLVFKVFNRMGQALFEARNMTQKWDGMVNGKPQPTGAYVWMLNYIDTDTGKEVSQRGTSVLIR